MMRYIDKYKMKTPEETSWDVSEWQFFAWTLSAFMLFILANVFWETIKNSNGSSMHSPVTKKERRIVVIPMREQLFLFLHRIGSYASILVLLLWRYGKDKFHTWKHKLVQ